MIALKCFLPSHSYSLKCRTVMFSTYDMISDDVITVRANQRCACVCLGFNIFQYMIFVTSCDSVIISK